MRGIILKMSTVNLFFRIPLNIKKAFYAKVIQSENKREDILALLMKHWANGNINLNRLENKK